MPRPSHNALRHALRNALRHKRDTIITVLEGTLCVIAAIALSRVPLFTVPQGGAVDLELAPLIYFAWRRGPRWGAVAGALGGIGAGLLDPYVYNLTQAFLDYPLAYACVGVAPLFRRSLNNYVLGLYLAAACNLLCHVVSGVLFFAQYAPKDMHPMAYALFYNGAFLIPKYVLSGIVAWILLM